MVKTVKDLIVEQEERFSALATESNRGTIDLPTFSKVFFPMFVEYFVGEKTPNLNFWFTKTVTNGYQFVDVLDSKGEIVFSVPPLYDSSSTASFGRGDLNPAEHMALVQIKDRSMPGAGTNHANAFFEEVVSTETENPEDIRSFYSHWTRIFEHYGYTSTSASDSKTTVSNVSINEDDFDGYEDL